MDWCMNGNELFSKLNFSKTLFPVFLFLYYINVYSCYLEGA